MRPRLPIDLLESVQRLLQFQKPGVSIGPVEVPLMN